MTKETGGPAFPEHLAVTESSEIHCGDAGMTLRDYFAAKALPTAMRAPWRDVGYVPVDGLTDFQQYARLAYQMADAMLAERAK